MDISKDYKGHCLTCNNYNPTTNWSEIHSSKGFWCSKHGWCDPYDKCGSYSKSCHSESYLEDCMKAYNKKKSYYIVTTVCNIMRFPEDNIYRRLFAETTELYLMGTEDGEQLLTEYDVYGQEVAWIIERLAYNENNRNFIVNFIKENILPEFDKMVEDIKNGNANRAMIRYIVLTRRLMDRFDIAYTPVEAKYKGEGYSPIHDTLEALKRSK